MSILSTTRGLAGQALKAAPGLAGKALKYGAEYLPKVASKAALPVAVAYGLFGNPAKASEGEEGQWVGDQWVRGGQKNSVSASAQINPQSLIPMKAKSNSAPITSTSSRGSSGSSKSSSKSSSNPGSSDSALAKKQIQEQEKANQRAAEEQYNSSIQAALRNKTTGETKINELLAMLGASFDQGKGRLDQGLTAAKSDFETEKSADENKLRAFYAMNGTGDSEQAGQGRERLYSDYAKRFGGLEQQYGNSLADLNTQNQETGNQYRGKLMDINDAYTNAESQARAGKYQSEAEGQDKISKLLADLRDYNLKEKQFNLDQLKTDYAINKPYGGGAQKNDSLTKVGVKPDGTPIWYNNATHQYVDNLPAGTQNAVDPLLSALQGMGTMGASNPGNQIQANVPTGYQPTGRYENGKPTYVDALGNEGIFN